MEQGSLFIDVTTLLISFVLEPVARLFAENAGGYWLYLFSSLTVALLLFWSRDTGEQVPTLRRFWRYAFPRALYGHPSSRLDLLYTMVNAVVQNAAVVPLLTAAPWVAQVVAAGLRAGLGEPDPLVFGGFLDQLWLTAGLVLAADLGFYELHVLKHRVPFLWEFHKVHHSATVLTPLTAYRKHPVDQLLDGLCMGAATGVMFGVVGYRYQGVAEPLYVLGNNAIVFLFLFMGTHLRHSHLWLSYGPVLERILVSPAQHQVHHSIAPGHVGKNFGGIFAIWDLLFQTLYVARRKESLVWGLPNQAHQSYNTVWRLYVEPLRCLAQRGVAAIKPSINNPGGVTMKRSSWIIPASAIVGLALAVAVTVHHSFATAQSAPEVGQPNVMPKGEPSPPAKRYPAWKEPLKTLQGVDVLAVAEGGKVYAYRLTPKGQQPLKDGDYKLTNGNAIRVRGGRIIWDQSGAVRKYEQGLAMAPVVLA
ncbi:MAG: sterol desaturase family protein [bacterium]